MTDTGWESFAERCMPLYNPVTMSPTRFAEWVRAAYLDLTTPKLPPYMVRVHHNGKPLPFPWLPWITECTCGFIASFPKWEMATRIAEYHAKEHETRT